MAQKAAVADVMEDFGRKLLTSTTGVAALLHNPLAPPIGVPALPLSPKLSTGKPRLRPKSHHS